jgi:hypothetical protein
VKVARTLLFLANLARVIPVNPIMLLDVTHYAVERDVESAAAERPDAGDAPAGQVAEARLIKEAWLVKGLRTSKS